MERQRRDVAMCFPRNNAHWRPVAGMMTKRSKIAVTLRIIVAQFALAAVLTKSAWSQSDEQFGIGDDITPPGKEFRAGHGSFSIEYSRPFDHGDYQGPAGVDSGQVQFQTITLEGSYFVADNWEVRASIPFSRAKADGMQQHPKLPSQCNADFTVCAITFVDNGNYHSTWANWDFGVTYHTIIGDNYHLAPALDVYVPSHNYPFYGSAVVGQRETQYGISIELEHQFDFSNFYYTVAYQYVIKPRTLGIDSNYNDFAFDLGYFINPRLGIRLITDTRIGHGLTDADVGASFKTYGGIDNNPVWALHDKVRLQNHANVGMGIDYAINDRYSAAFSTLTSVWGQSNARLANGIDLKLTRSF